MAKFPRHFQSSRQIIYNAVNWIRIRIQRMHADPKQFASQCFLLAYAEKFSHESQDAVGA